MSRSRARREAQRARRQSVRAILAPKLPAPLVAAWVHACWAFGFICRFHTTPRQLARQEYIQRPQHRVLLDLVRHLELLARRIVLAAALALVLILKPIARGPARHRKHRRVILWPDNPASWRPRFCMLPKGSSASDRKRAPPEPLRFLKTFPLACRFEGVRRVLASPDAYVRRFAIRFTRFAARNQTSNAPRMVELKPWLYQWGIGPRTRGARLVNDGMRLAQSLAEDQLVRFNEAAEPG
jgi:hypothetical protein